MPRERGKKQNTFINNLTKAGFSHCPVDQQIYKQFPNALFAELTICIPPECYTAEDFQKREEQAIKLLQEIKTIEV